MSEKYLKIIAEELELIRKEIQYHNDMKFQEVEEDTIDGNINENIPIADRLNGMFKKSR